MPKMFFNDILSIAANVHGQRALFLCHMTIVVPGKPSIKDLRGQTIRLWAQKYDRATLEHSTL